MQSVSEMMIYKRTLIINVNNNDELHCVIDDNSLNTEDSYILSIKSYMDNDSILDRIKNESEFKNITWDVAKLEGENISLEEWRKVHIDYFSKINTNFNDNTKVIFEIAVAGKANPKIISHT